MAIILQVPGLRGKRISLTIHHRAFFELIQADPSGTPRGTRLVNAADQSMVQKLAERIVPKGFSFIVRPLTNLNSFQGGPYKPYMSAFFLNSKGKYQPPIVDAKGLEAIALYLCDHLERQEDGSLALPSERPEPEPKPASAPALRP